MIDLGEVKKVVDDCDVFTIGCRMFPERFIIDTRSSESEGPMVEVVEPVATVEERFFWLGQRRPSFGMPKQFSFFVWPHSLNYFDESGLGKLIRERVYPGDESGQIGAQMAKSMFRLHLLEQRATYDAVHGRNYHTLWERSEPEGDASPG
jgi:hypothetical protein